MWRGTIASVLCPLMRWIVGRSTPAFTSAVMAVLAHDVRRDQLRVEPGRDHRSAKRPAHPIAVPGKGGPGRGDGKIQPFGSAAISRSLWRIAANSGVIGCSRSEEARCSNRARTACPTDWRQFGDNARHAGLGLGRSYSIESQKSAGIVR